MPGDVTQSVKKVKKVEYKFLSEKIPIFCTILDVFFYYIILFYFNSKKIDFTPTFQNISNFFLIKISSP